MKGPNMKRKTLKITSIALTAFNAVMMTATLVGGFVMNHNSAAINMFFHTETSKVIDEEAEKDPDKLQYFKSDYVDKDNQKAINGEIIQEKDREVSEQVEAEGAVLLWNNEETLPMAKKSKVSLLSGSSARLVETGSGSGYIPSSDYSANLKDSLTEDDIEVNPTLWDFYTNGAGKNYKRTEKGGECSENATLSVNEVPWNVYTNQVKSSFEQYGDYAVIVLSRTGGEYSDAKGHGIDTHKKNYLELTNEEVTLFKNVIELKNQGTFDKLVLLINSGNQIQFTELQDFMEDIDACMYIGQPGTYGAKAVADLLVGDITPSGRLADTWCYDNQVAPASYNDGDYQYADYSKYKLQNAKLQNDYMVYQEGIYIGYRYFETRYEDYILDQGNAGEFSYGDNVLFPFGFGKSYTEFAYSNFKVQEKDDSYIVTVDVKNAGNTAGKDTLQVYLQKPYMDYDRENSIEKSAVELAAYCKTDVLKKDETKQYTLEVKKNQLRTYDRENQQTYIAEGGDYYFTLGTDSHDAINNILAEKGKGGSTDYSGDTSLVYKKTLKDGFCDFTKTEETGMEIQNQLDLGDINLEGSGDNEVIYLSRNNWEETFPTKNVSLIMTPEMANDVAYDKEFEEEEGLEMPTYGAKNNLTAFSFKDAAWDDTHWDELLDEMTWEEQAYLCSNGYHHTQEAESIALPSSNEENGPVGITKRSDFPLPGGQYYKNDYKFCAYPNGPMMGSTFNDALIEDMGRHMSEDMLYTGYSGIYGPGVNLHRTAFGGRAWEYPSEDSYLAGKISANEIKGIQYKGCMAFAKHFALNDVETNRRHVGVWSNEQATREIYLQAFEYALIDGDCYAMMNSFTRIGTQWCGACPKLITTILRDEWGWHGINISDWDSGGPMSKIDGILGGTDSFDGNNNAESYRKWENSPTVAKRLRESSKRFIYTLLKTNAFNGISATSKVVQVTPIWHTIIWTAAYVFIGLTGLSLIFLVITLIRKEPKKEN